MTLTAAEIIESIANLESRRKVARQQWAEANRLYEMRKAEIESDLLATQEKCPHECPEMRERLWTCILCGKKVL